jgi:hypothetical protein
MKGVHAQQLPSYLDEFMWRERFGRTAQQVLLLTLPSSILFDVFITNMGLQVGLLRRLTPCSGVRLYPDFCLALA